MGNPDFKSPVAYDYVSAAGIRPRNDCVLLRWANLPDTTASGLVALPRSREAQSHIDGKLALVVAVGDGPAYARKCKQCQHTLDPYPMGVQVGDVVVTDGHLCGELVYVNGIEHRLVRQAEIMEVWEAETEDERAMLASLFPVVASGSEAA